MVIDLASGKAYPGVKSIKQRLKDVESASGQIASLWPLPGSRGFLFTACTGNCALGSSVWSSNFGADSARLVLTSAAGAWYSPESGQLLSEYLA